MNFGPVIPVLRFFDEAKMREFYLEFLGFEVTFEFRFEPDTPLYLGVQRGNCLLVDRRQHHLRARCGEGELAIGLLVDVGRFKLLAISRFEPADKGLEGGAVGVRPSDPHLRPRRATRPGTGSLSRRLRLE